MNRVMTSVESSNIEAVGYNAENRILHVDFLIGTSYDYYDVDESVYNALVSADSVGKYFNANVRDSYSYSQV